MPPQLLDAAREFGVGLLQVMGEEGHVEATAEGEGVYVDLRGVRRLPTDAAFRAALSRVARLYLKSHYGQDVPVVVDVNGELLVHREELARKARDVAGQVVMEGRRIELAPMPADDRRVVHMALADVPGVRTSSVGREPNRRVVVEPATK
jgi:spoIIIJ-associated protein